MIPFIDESRLLEAMAPLEAKMTPEEARRNRHGPMFVASYTVADLGTYPAPAHFPPVSANHALAEEVWREAWDVPISKLRKGLMAGVKLDVFFPGFPTLKHIRHSARLHKAGVRVFEQSSRGGNMLLALEAKVVAVQGQGVTIDAKGESQGGDFDKLARGIE